MTIFIADWIAWVLAIHNALVLQQKQFQLLLVDFNHFLLLFVTIVHFLAIVIVSYQIVRLVLILLLFLIITFNLNFIPLVCLTFFFLVLTLVLVLFVNHLLLRLNMLLFWDFFDRHRLDRAIREIRGCMVQSVIIFRRDKQFPLLFSKVLIWIHSRLSQDCHISLQLLNLVKVVNECLRHLFNKQWTIRYIELNLCFNLIVRILERFHFLLGPLWCLLSLLSQVLAVRDQRRRTLDSLLQSSLLDVSIDFLLKETLLFCFFLLLLLTPEFDSRIMFRRGCWLFHLDLRHMLHWTSALFG